MIDDKGAPLTQGLFLETSYGNTENVIYTLKSRDHVYKGRKLFSIKRLYLEMEDPTEYQFSYEYFLDWDHWNRIKRNKTIASHLEGLEEELEVRLRAKGVSELIKHANSGNSFQAAKWLADRGWDKRAAGRPSKEEMDRESKIQNRIAEEFNGDIVRLYKEG